MFSKRQTPDMGQESIGSLVIQELLSLDWLITNAPNNIKQNLKSYTPLTEV
jgi:hypothetical protein